VSAFGITIEYRVGSETGPDVLRQLGVAFERAGAELARLDQHIFPLLTPVFERAEQRQFDAQGAGPVAGAWEALSPAYAEWKLERYPGAPILQRTEAMLEGLTQSTSAYALRDSSNDSFVFGTRGLPYASLHQTGTARMPVRPVFDFDEEFERELERAARQGVNAAIKAARLDDFVGEVPES
jgi:phage gpG-like protein